MNCKNCQAELEEGITLCPQCGTENAEQPVEAAAVEETSPAETSAEVAPVEEAPAVETPAETSAEEATAKTGLSAGKITLLVALAVVAIGIVIALIVGGMGGSEPAETTLPQTTADAVPETTVPATILADGNPDDATCKGSYTVSDDVMLQEADTVVATMGEAQLTNAELQIYYWMQVYDFLNQYGSYASMFGLDYTAPMDTQLSLEGTMTWQQYFLDSAINAWGNYQALAQAANENGFVLDQEYADYLAALPEDMEQNALDLGYESALAMVQADMGVGATMEGYLKYLESYYLGYMYYGTSLEAIEITDADVEAYFDEHAAEYLENGLEKTDEVYVDVRHILLAPEGGTTAEDGTTTYSEEEWETCRLAAQNVLNEWLSGEMTEESFAALANTHSVDGGSNTVGGLYEDVYVGQMVEPFEQWCFDESRQPGDYGLVKTDYGYHIMYFVNSDLVWFLTAESDLLAEKGNEFLQNTLDAHPYEVDYSAMVLGDVSLAAAQ